MSAWLCWASASNVTSEDAPGESAASGRSGPSGRLLPGTSHGGVILAVAFFIAPPALVKPSLSFPQSFSAPGASTSTSELLSIGSGTMTSDLKRHCWRRRRAARKGSAWRGSVANFSKSCEHPRRAAGLRGRRPQASRVFLATVAFILTKGSKSSVLSSPTPAPSACSRRRPLPTPRPRPTATLGPWRSLITRRHGRSSRS